jgi:hypothetical protein
VKRAELCARLINGYLRKDEVPQLAVDDELYRDVQERLRQVGLQLADTAFSDYYGTKQLDENPELQEYCDHHNLQRNLAALLVLLWGKLIYPKLVAMADDTPKLEDLQGPREYTLDEDRFIEEYAARFGGKTYFRSFLWGRAKNLGYVEFAGEKGRYRAGPPLEVLIDHEAMLHAFQQHVLDFKTLKQEQNTEPEERVRGTAEEDGHV